MMHDLILCLCVDDVQYHVLATYLVFCIVLFSIVGFSITTHVSYS